MGSSFTMTLASIFMWYWEKILCLICTHLMKSMEGIINIFDFFHFTPIFSVFIQIYWRCIFYVECIVTSTSIIVSNLNGKHTNIKLVYEFGVSVSFLDVLIQNNNGILSTSVYHKEAAEPYVVPFTSDHPLHIFRNIIIIAFRRGVRYSSTFDAFNAERRYIRLKLLYNGWLFFILKVNYAILWRIRGSFYRYPSKFIDAQFRKFVAKHNISSLSSLLPMMDNPSNSL